MAVKATAQDRRELELYLEKLKQIAEYSLVDYSETDDDKKQRIEISKKDFRFFASHYFPHYCDSEAAPFHIEAAEELLANKHYKGIQEWARGHAKSVYFDIIIPIWLHLFHDEIKCMLLVGKNQDAAKRLLGDMQAEFEANQQLKHDFGKLVQQGSWEDGNFTTSKGSMFFAIGKKQSPRGLRNGPYRPDYIVLDDADDDIECLNPRRIDDSVDWVLRALIPAMSADTARFVMVNNRIGKYTILTNLASNKNFKHRIVNAIKEDGTVSWNKFTREYFDALQRTIGWAAFSTEYMNAPISEGKIFIDDYIQFKPSLPLKEYDSIVAYWDIAYSEAKTADYNAIVVCGITGREVHVLKAVIRQCKMEDALRSMYAIEYYINKSNGFCEWYGETQFWNDAVEIAMNTVGDEQTKRLPIVFTDRPGRGENKYKRILQLLPQFQRGEIYFAERERHNNDMQRLIEQLKSIEPGGKGHDDGPDALEGAISRLNERTIMTDFVPILGNREKSKRIY